jgi:hypothetical protein
VNNRPTILVFVQTVPAGLSGHPVGSTRGAATRRWSDRPSVRCRPPAEDPHWPRRCARTRTPPLRSAYPSYPIAGQVLIHELTHAWQIEHTDISDGFVPGLMCTGIYNQTVLGQAAYHYGRPGPPWSSFNMEAQAAIVDQWFAGTTPPPPGRNRGRCRTRPTRTTATSPTASSRGTRSRARPGPGPGSWKMLTDPAWVVPGPEVGVGAETGSRWVIADDACPSRANRSAARPGGPGVESPLR